MDKESTELLPKVYDEVLLMLNEHLQKIDDNKVHLTLLCLGYMCFKQLCFNPNSKTVIASLKDLIKQIEQEQKLPEKEETIN